MNDCENGGHSQPTCQCELSYFEQRVSYQTFQQGCDNDSVSPTPAQQARAAAIAAEITTRLTGTAFALPGTLADRMTRCGYPGCVETARESLVIGTL